MLVLYYPPFRAETDEELYDQTIIALRARVEDLIEFPLNILEEGWKQVRRTHKTERWPIPQVIRDACLACQAPTRTASSTPAAAPFVPRHASGESEEQKHRRIMDDLYARASPEQRGTYDMLLARMRSGESSSAILRDIWAGEPLKEMPLLPGERMGRSKAERVRTDSLRRSEEVA